MAFKALETAQMKRLLQNAHQRELKEREERVASGETITIAGILNDDGSIAVPLSDVTEADRRLILGLVGASAFTSTQETDPLFKDLFRLVGDPSAQNESVLVLDNRQTSTELALNKDSFNDAKALQEKFVETLGQYPSQGYSQRLSSLLTRCFGVDEFVAIDSGTRQQMRWVKEESGDLFLELELQATTVPAELMAEHKRFDYKTGETITNSNLEFSYSSKVRLKVTSENQANGTPYYKYTPIAVEVNEEVTDTKIFLEMVVGNKQKAVENAFKYFAVHSASVNAVNTKAFRDALLKVAVSAASESQLTTGFDKVLLKFAPNSPTNQSLRYYYRHRDELAPSKRAEFRETLLLTATASGEQASGRFEKILHNAQSPMSRFWSQHKYTLLVALVVGVAVAAVLAATVVTGGAALPILGGVALGVAKIAGVGVGALIGGAVGFAGGATLGGTLHAALSWLISPRQARVKVSVRPPSQVAASPAVVLAQAKPETSVTEQAAPKLEVATAVSGVGVAGVSSESVSSSPSSRGPIHRVDRVASLLLTRGLVLADSVASNSASAESAPAPC